MHLLEKNGILYWDNLDFLPKNLFYIKCENFSFCISIQKCQYHEHSCLSLSQPNMQSFPNTPQESHNTFVRQSLSRENRYLHHDIIVRKWWINYFVIIIPILIFYTVLHHFVWPIIVLVEFWKLKIEIWCHGLNISNMEA